MATHLVVFYTATSGVNGPTLGSDEEDIVLVQYLVWDISGGKVLTEQQYVVRPGGVDINENLLSEQSRQDFGLTEDTVNNGQTVDVVIDSFDAILTKLYCDGSKVNLVSDGQLHLRQVLHPKAVAKGIELPYFYHSFFDLRKEFKSFYHQSADVHSVKEMSDYLELPADTNANLAVRSVRDMCKIIKRMTTEGHRFAIPEMVNIRLEPGICTRSEEVDNGCVVRARGLPWQSSDQDIAKFFRGLNIAKGGVALCLSPQGRRNGEALVRFASAEHRDMALKRHKHHIGNRYIEVYKATGDDFINVAGGNNNEAQQFLSRGGQVIIRMRGLPYDCTAKQVVDFFEGSPQSVTDGVLEGGDVGGVNGGGGCSLLDGEEGVLFVRKPDGRATGDAFVLFPSEEDSAKALAKHREIIGSRYIELFRSTTAEVQQVLNRSMDPRTYEQQPPLIGQMPQIPILPQQFITGSNRRDCIRLRGLPYEAQVEHVLDFLGEHAKSIVFRGVHMVINAQGQPSGEAFIQMDGEQSAFLAAQNRHHRYMVFGKKQRYIEVFQCSGEDMNLVLSGGLPAQRTVVSPGMFMWDQGAVSPPMGPPPQQGAGPNSPGLFHPPPPTRAHLPPGAILSPSYSPHHLHQSFGPSTPNGTPTLLPGLVAAAAAQQVKPEHHHQQQHQQQQQQQQQQVFVANSMLQGPPSMLPLRHQFFHPPQFELSPHSQQHQTATLVQSFKAPPQSIHQAFLGQYGDMGGFAAPPAPPSAAGGVPHPGMLFVHNNKLHHAAASAFPPGAAAAMQPQMSFVNAVTSSAMDVRKSPQNLPPNYAAKYSLLPMPFAAAPQQTVRGGPVSGGGKRSFEQAFRGDKGGGLPPGKRPPPRLGAPPGGPMGPPPPRVSNPHLGQAQLQPQSPLSMGPQMIPTLYPPPQMYPPPM